MMIHQTAHYLLTHYIVYIKYIKYVVCQLYSGLKNKNKLNYANNLVHVGKQHFIFLSSRVNLFNDM